MTHFELKNLLENMLPGRVFMAHDLCWCQTGAEVRDTEMLYLCALLEARLDGIGWMHYLRNLAMAVRTPEQTDVAINQYILATWQQRVEALSKVFVRESPAPEK